MNNLIFNLKNRVLSCLFCLVVLIIPFASAKSMDEDTQKLFFNVNDFALIDYTGKLHQLTRKINSRFVVLYSYCIGCPIARKNIPALRNLKKHYAKKDVDFYYIDPAQQDTREMIAEETKKYDLPFPVLLDDTQEITRQLKINRTGEAIVIDTKRNFKIVYRGPVDDKQSYGTEKVRASKEHLKNALDSLLKNKKVKTPYLRSLGCALVLRQRPEVTYYKNIKPLLEQKCASCHQTLETPPTNFFNYADARNWSAMIKEVIQVELMPPWEVDPAIHVQNQSYLTREEKEEIYSWIESGMKEGEPKDYVKRDQGNFGISLLANDKLEDYNYSLQIKNPVKLKADGQVNWHYELVDVNEGDDFWVNHFTMQSKLSTPNLVQHVQIIVAKEDIPELNNVRSEFLPYEILKKVHGIINLSNQNGVVASKYLDKAYRIPKGARIYLETHFAKTGRDEEALIKVIMKKHQKKGEMKEIFYTPRASEKNIKIPPNVDDFKITKAIPFNRDVTLFRLAAHMHLRGNHARVYIKEKQDSEPRLIFNSRYLFKNRRTYDFIEPIKIKKDSFLIAELEYDNSKGNPAQINHDATVLWGEDAAEGEMMLMHLYYYVEGI